MSTLIKDIETFKKHVTVNFGFPFDTILPYIKKQERKHIKSILGKDLFESIQQPTEGTTQQEVLDLLIEASANLAILSFSKTATVVISKSGFLKSQGPDIEPASWSDLRDMRREFLRTGSEALDEALEIMEENEEEYEEWIDTEGYTSFKECFVRSTQDFQKRFNIEKSRLTFLSLKAHLFKVEKKYFRGLVGMETVLKIKSAASPEAKEALRLAQDAQVPLCISEIAKEGMFMITSKGMFYQIDEIPGEKMIKLEQTELDRLYDAKQEEGNENLKYLLEYLKEQPQVFTEYAARKTNEISSTAHNTKSVVSF